MQTKSENCLAIKKNKNIIWKNDFNMKNNEKQYITQPLRGQALLRQFRYFFNFAKSKYLAPYSIRIPIFSFSSKQSPSAYFMSSRKLGLVKVSVKSLSPEKLQPSIRLWHLGCHSALLYPSSEKCQELFSSEVETHRTRHTNKTHPPM